MRWGQLGRWVSLLALGGWVLSSALGGWVLSSALGGCAVASMDGELTAFQCNNGRDDDGDVDIDCDDTDCQIFEHCRRGPPASGAGGGGGSFPALPFDAGSPPTDASRPSLVSDGGPVCPQAPCPDGETCVSGVCVPRQLVVGDLWVITSIQANVPRSVDYSLVDPRCIDDDCNNPVALPPFFLCGCLPDPQVRVFVDGEHAGATEPALNVDAQHWTTNIEVILLPDSRIRFDVLDLDPLAEELLYSCDVAADPAVLATGTVACEQRFATDAMDVAFGVQATVRASSAN